MARGSSEVLRQLHTLFEAGTIGGVPDGQLLDRFVDRRDEVAFRALVERHGPMVLRVCRGVLGDMHDAEDAFQATFLVLARKAGSIRKHDSVGPWLHGVAHRISARMKCRAARRRSHDRRAYEVERAGSQSSQTPDLSWMWAELNEEVDRLPERYRAPVVLCYLEGLTNEEAAFRLRWPVGTVKVRLHRAREKLQVRLTRRGLAPAVGLLGAASSADATVLVPPALFELTVRAASSRALIGVVAASVISLTEGALRTMMLTKLKLAAGGILAVGAVSIGAGAILGLDRAKAGPDAAVSSGTKGPDVVPGREDVEAAKTRLLKELRNRLDADQIRHDEGRVTTSRLLDSMDRLLAAEQQVAATNPERLRALEAYIQRVEGLLRGATAEREKASASKPGGSTEENAQLPRRLQEDVSEIQIRLDAATLRLAAELGAARGVAEGEKPSPYRTRGGVDDSSAQTEANHPEPVIPNLINVVGDMDGAKVWAFDRKSRTWHTYRAPAGMKARPFIVDFHNPVLEGGAHFVVLEIEGEKITELVAFCPKSKGWVRQALHEPVSGEIPPTLWEEKFALYQMGRHAYAFSALTGTWDSVDLGDAQGSRVEKLGVPGMAIVKGTGPLYAYDARTGRFSDVELDRK